MYLRMVSNSSRMNQLSRFIVNQAFVTPAIVYAESILRRRRDMPIFVSRTSSQHSKNVDFVCYLLEQYVVL